jgi:hypothetical protein
MSVMTPLNPKGESTNKGGEYSQVSATPKVVPSTIPSAADHKSAMIDGPYGGKKPA